jgi:hypothetical protein
MPNALIVAFLALIALHGRGAEAAAPECLSAVDDMIVEYDVPVSAQIPGAQFGGSGAPSNPHAPAPKAHGRPVPPPRATSGRHALGAEQRKRLQDVLHLARTAEARGDEEQCMGLLRQARRLVAPSR